MDISAVNKIFIAVFSVLLTCKGLEEEEKRIRKRREGNRKMIRNFERKGKRRWRRREKEKGKVENGRIQNGENRREKGRGKAGI